MEWTYLNDKFPYAMIGENFGFVYVITNTVTDRKYLGKKWFWSSRKKKVKGKKRAVRLKLESDWESYYGSSAELTADVEKYGKDKFRREIIHLCKTKGDASYYEAKYQFECGVLESDQWYNAWIIVRVRKNHLTSYKNRQTSS
jgi:hypothetical protein